MTPNLKTFSTRRLKTLAFSNEYQLGVGDLLVCNADSDNINVMLITHRFYSGTSNIYIVSRNGKSAELREDLIINYIKIGKIKVIKRIT